MTRASVEVWQRAVAKFWQEQPFGINEPIRWVPALEGWPEGYVLHPQLARDYERAFDEFPPPLIVSRDEAYAVVERVRNTGRSRFHHRVWEISRQTRVRATDGDFYRAGNEAERAVKANRKRATPRIAATPYYKRKGGRPQAISDAALRALLAELPQALSVSQAAAEVAKRVPRANVHTMRRRIAALRRSGA